MIKTYWQFFEDVSKKLYLRMDFKNNLEFERKYIAISIQRSKLLKLATFALSFYYFYLDLNLYIDNTSDITYRRTLVMAHIIILILSIVFYIIYKFLEKTDLDRFSKLAKILILFDMFGTVLIATLISVNSQRFNGNIDVYILATLAVALIIPMYPKWVLGIYGLNHLFFLAGISHVCKNNTAIIKQTNATSTVLTAIVLFLIIYNYNVKSFLSEQRLKEDKLTFIKLFETSPFPLLISRFEDGNIRYINQKAIVFYDIKQEKVDTMHHSDVYQNISDLNKIRKMLEENGKLNDYIVEQKTLLGQTKWAIVNYELIDYFGEKSILSGVADITEIKRMENELKIHASTDALTGVLNRRVGMELIKEKFDKAKDDKAEFDLCFFDVDNLKLVNDKYGHLEGDSLIAAVCKAIKEEMKPNDTMFRYGGDEFILCFDGSSESDIQQTCNRINERFDAMNLNGHKPYSIHVSMGMFSHKPEMNLSLERMIEMVDKNMYNNKLRNKKMTT